MLTQKHIDGAKPREKPYKLSDGQQLWLYVDPSGGRWWRFRYSYAGRRRQLSLGTYPATSLAMARRKRDEVRALLAEGKDPSRERQRQKIKLALTFGELASEYVNARSSKLADITKAKLQWLVELLKPLASMPAVEVAATDILGVIKPHETAGKLETAHRLRATAGRILRYGVATGRVERDVTADLKGALAPLKPTSHAALTDPRDVSYLMRAIETCDGFPASIAALKLSPLLLTRPGELRKAEWSEMDLEEATWRIPGARTKMRKPLTVPLPRQAMVILRELHMLTGRGKYVFPSTRTSQRPLSNGTLTAMLRRLGYSGDQQTAHGFRSLGSTLLNETDADPELIERSLGHAVPGIRGIYDRSVKLPQRRKLLQEWADYLDGLREQGDLAASNT